jgi:putative component of membrane protein insertase Oxa1/YidC/SpoIIIJ protein YidD
MGMVVLILISSVAYLRASIVLPNTHTRLLFNWVISEDGYDTGIAISNTSMDPFSTAHQSGTCTLYFYPGTSKYTTTAISAGGQWTGRALVMAPEFLQGYVIADCDFHCAHGTAEISTNNGNTIAIYPALVLTNGARPAPESLGE